MSIFSSIGHAVSSAWHDVFGGGSGRTATTTTTTQALRKVSTAQPSTNQNPLALIKPDKPQLNLVQLADGSLKKATPNTQPTVTTTTTVAPPKPDKPSLLHKVTHNPVTDFAGAVAHPFGEFGNALIHVPKAVYREVQNKPIYDIQKDVFGTTNEKEIAKKIAGDTATIGLTIAAPGLDNAASTVGGRLLSSTGSRALQKVVPRVVSNAGLGAAFTGIQSAEHGASLKQTAEEAGKGALIGGLAGGVFAGIPLLRKASVGKANALETGEEVAADVATPAADELASGVKSANPSQAADAAEQAANAAPEGLPAPREISTGNAAPEAPAGAPAPVTVQRPGATPAPEPAPVAAGTVAPEIRMPAVEPPVAVIEPDLNTPAYVRRQAVADQQATARAVEETAAQQLDNAPVGEAPLDRPTFLHKQDIQAAIDDGQAQLDDYVNTHPGAAPVDIENAQANIKQQVVERIQKIQDARNPDVTPPPPTPTEAVVAAAEGEPVVPVADANGNPTMVSSREAAQQAEAAGVNPNPVPGEPAPLPAVSQPAEAALTADVAPRTHDALVKQIGDMGETLKGQYGKRAAIDIEDLKSQAQGAIANMSDEQVLRSFATVGPDDMVRDPQSFALARAALDRISQNADDPQAVQTVTNIMNALDKYVSKSGQALRLVQEDFDNMPLPMKVRYIVKKIDNANANTKGYTALAEDPAQADLVERTITNYLRGSEEISGRVAQLQGQLNDIADAARAGQGATEDIAQIGARLDGERRALAANNGELVKYYTKLMPKRSAGQRTNDFARNMMLGSFTGRVNDLLTTSQNIINQALQNTTQGLLAKAVNLFKPGAVLDTLRGVKAFGRGTAGGVREGATEFGGTQYAGDLQKALTSNVGERTGLQKATNPITRTIQSATEFATKASQGVREQRLYQLAVKEGQGEGLRGGMLKQYAEARSRVPSRQMTEAADTLHRQVNNLNDNPVSRTLNRVAASIGTDQPGVAGTVGGVIRNQVIPFTSWLGGNIWNTFTDKNVVASLVKVMASAGKGDLDGVVANIAKTANNAAYTYALGYLMTEKGLITNTDPQGYNDHGAYLHIGGRYIPVAFTGFFAPSIILGNATYHGLNDNADASPGDKIAATASQSLLNLSKSVSLANAVGADNNISRVIAEVQQPGSKSSAGDVGAQLAGNVAGQFIPALGGDINAVINNGLTVGNKELISDKFNPTHERADTSVKKLNPATGNMVKDKTRSAVASFENRIPGFSQTLPRKAGVAAPDLVDRTTKGSRDTGASVQAAKDAKAKVDMAAYNKANDIPDPNGTYKKGDSFENAIQARVERGEWDKAIGGLQQKLDSQKKDKDIPQSKNDGIEKQIKTLTVNRDGGWAPDMIETYKKTSLSEWRAMGDPESDSYDPIAYRQLYQYDSELAKAGVSASTKKGSDNKFFAKPDKKGKGRGSGVDRSISSNTIGSTPDLGTVSFGDLAPQKITNAQIPTIQQIQPKDLIKKRKISVSGVR